MKKVLSLICAILFFFVPTFRSGDFALAESTTGSAVLDDLSQNEDFNVDDYPVDEDDYSLDVITVAESKDGELLIYVYQPSGSKKDFHCNYLNMAFGDDESELVDDLDLYSLTFLNSNGTLYKYRVNGYTLFDLFSADIRYYYIVSVYRAFDSTIDVNTAENYQQTVSSVSYPVGKKFAFSMLNGNYISDCSQEDYVTITDKYVSFVDTSEMTTDMISLFLYSQNVAEYEYFIAFDTDRDLGDLLSATVTYSYKHFFNYVNASTGRSQDYYTESVTKTSTFSNTDYGVTSSGIGLLRHSFTWKRIYTVDEFLNSQFSAKIFSCGFGDLEDNIKFNDETRQILSDNYKYVLCFAELPFQDSFFNNEKVFYKPVVQDVGILSLSFLVQGTYYNLGVVDNLQNSSLISSNDSSLKFEINAEFEDFLIIFAIITLIIIILLIIPYIVKFFRFVFGIVSAPFKHGGRRRRKR